MGRNRIFENRQIDLSWTLGPAWLGFCRPPWVQRFLTASLGGKRKAGKRGRSCDGRLRTETVGRGDATACAGPFGEDPRGSVDGIGECLCRGTVGSPCTPRIVGGAAALRPMFLSRSRRWKVFETIGGKCRSAIQRGSLVKNTVGRLCQGAIERNGRNRNSSRISRSLMLRKASDPFSPNSYRSNHRSKP